MSLLRVVTRALFIVQALYLQAKTRNMKLLEEAPSQG